MTEITELQRLTSIEALTRLKALWVRHLDARNADAFIPLFAEDALCEFDSAQGEDGIWRGREEIRRGYTKAWAARPKGELAIHLAFAPILDVTSETAADGNWRTIVLRKQPGERTGVSLVGAFDESYIRVDGEWQIARCRLDIAWYEE